MIEIYNARARSIKQQHTRRGASDIPSRRRRPCPRASTSICNLRIRKTQLCSSPASTLVVVIRGLKALKLSQPDCPTLNAACPLQLAAHDEDDELVQRAERRSGTIGDRVDEVAPAGIAGSSTSPSYSSSPSPATSAALGSASSSSSPSKRSPFTNT